MMNLDAYFQDFQDQSTIHLVGPLCSSPIQIEEPVVFVDGGARFRKNDLGVSVGDGDSFGAALDVNLNPDKDFSDFAFVLDHIPDRFTHIQLHGFLGGRKDHELFNLGEAHQFLKDRICPGKMAFDQKIFAFSKGAWAFERKGLFSLAVIETATVTLTGSCRYTCNSPTEFKPLSSLGLSNVGNGTIYLECGGPVLVIFEEDE